MIGSGASSKAAGVSGADLRRDFGLVHKFLTAYDSVNPGCRRRRVRPTGCAVHVAVPDTNGGTRRMTLTEEP
ncbi:hypothetical protein GS416_11365 [Rhodococcus hoagii]|nr:hypothetical protein [Prescottella equi]